MCRICSCARVTYLAGDILHVDIQTERIQAGLPVNVSECEHLTTDDEDPGKKCSFH